MKKFIYIILLAAFVASCGTGYVQCDAYGANDVELEDLDKA